jgi:hypothetical protein
MEDEANWISQNFTTQLPKLGWAELQRAVAKKNKRGKRGDADERSDRVTQFWLEFCSSWANKGYCTFTFHLKFI